MLDNVWLSRFGIGIIKPEYFDTDQEERVARAIVQYRQTYGIAPKDPDDVIMMAGAGTEDLVHEIYEEQDSYDTKLAEDIVIQFAKEQSVKLAIVESIDDIQRGDLKAPLARMKEAVSVGDSILSPGIDPIADIDKWLYDYWSSKVPTGMPHVDNILEGGLGPGELGCMLAPQNKGKSLSLINIGYGAASILAGKNVAHFTHEMSTSQVAKRYAARMCFRFPSKTDDLQEYAEEVIEAARKLLPGKIRVIGGATRMSSHEIDAHMERLVAEGFEPGLIVDDYADLIVPTRHYNERRFEISANFEYLRGLGDRFGCPVWTASQSTRASHSKELITLADFAEDIGKASVSDVVISLCQTREEEETERCRLYMAKVRDGRNHSTIAAKYYSDCQAVITTGLVKYKKQERDV